MTTRERKERKADRLRDWSEGRKAKSAESFERADDIASNIPMGQPILVGHHSEGRHRRDIERIDNSMRKGVEHSRVAERHEEKAANIDRQLASSIYSDDEDAIEALEARIAKLEAEREEKKERNKRIRKLLKGVPSEEWADKLVEAGLGSAISPMFRPGVSMWAVTYDLSNLSGNIKRNRDRLAQLKRRAATAEKAEAAGGVLIEKVGDGSYCRITFADKPERDIINALKAAGFYWSSGSWAGKHAEIPQEVSAIA